MFSHLLIGLVVHKYLFIVSLSACADAPAGNTHQLFSEGGDSAKVTALFATQQANGQYCVYQNELTADAWQREPATAFALATATALTTHSVSADALSEALLLESDYTSRAFNTAPAALSPLLACGTVLVSLPMWRKKLLPASVAVLSCGVAALVIRRITAAHTEGERLARVSTAQLLADEAHVNDSAVHRLRRVLPWLVTENALPCRSAPQAQVEASQ